MEIEDPDPKNKRDVIVTFFDVDDFCSALIKNGRTIQSYVFDVCYDPYLIVSSVICRNLHRRGSMRNRGNRGGHGRRDDRDGHGRRNDRDNRESRDNRDNRDSRPHDDRSRDDSYYRRGSHRDGNLHREISPVMFEIKQTTMESATCAMRLVAIINPIMDFVIILIRVEWMMATMALISVS